MTSRTASAVTHTPLWSSFESAIRLTLRSLSAPAACASTFEELDSEQARIRRSSRHWLIG
jgi:hypothetical protein